MAVCGNCGKHDSEWGRPCYLSPTGMHITEKEPAILEGQPLTLRDRLAVAIYNSNNESEWLSTVDGSPNSASYEYADRALAAMIEDKLEREPENGET